MKNWQETKWVFAEARRLVSTNQPAALALIVGLEGSGYRKVGAKLLVRQDRSLLGNVSGGCLETDVAENALRALGEKKPRMVHYDTTGSDDKVWGLGVGCNGKVDLLIVPLEPDDILPVISAAEKHLQQGSPFALVTGLTGTLRGRFFVVSTSGIETSTGSADTDRTLYNLASSMLENGRSARCALEDSEVFIEVLQPPPRLIVCGANDNSRPLVRYAAEVGFWVALVDHRRAYATAERFPEAERIYLGRADEVEFDFALGENTLAAVVFHITEHDRAWVQRFAKAGVKYVGLLGSVSRCNDLLSGLSEQERARVYAPIGLDIGAVGPEQVAVSIIAEALAVWTGRPATHLRDRLTRRSG